MLVEKVPMLAPEIEPLSDQEYQLLRDLVYERFGIALGEQKRSLISGRLQKVLREKGFSSFQEYYQYVISDPSGEALSTLINRISTNHTFFYREPDHFEFFAETVLPRIIAEQKTKPHRSIRIWCPGCSSGEEPYTLAMLLLEALEGKIVGWDIGVLATDISTRVLDIAKAGVYARESIQRLPAALVQKYFHRLSTTEGQIQEGVKKIVLFRRLNLMRTVYPFKGKFHTIFCRNVMIYFDQATRSALVQRFRGLLEPGGYLIIGHSESLGRSDTRFRYVRPAVYQMTAP